MAGWKLKGEWLKNCNCLATCPCDTIGTPAPNDFCEGLVGMSIFDKEKRRARLTVPGFVETTSAPLMVIPTGDEQRVIVKMPDGFEYKEMEVAQAAMLKSNGAIKFEWQKTHSSLAEVEQTDKGLVA